MFRSFLSKTTTTIMLLILAVSFLAAQDTAALKSMLIGRWEVVKYHEQGLGVDKKQNPTPQAQQVYTQIAKTRAKTYFFYDSDEEPGNRIRRAYERWVERDSTIETNRIIQAISTPYFAVFFPDSTLSAYNKDVVTGFISFPEAHHYTFYPRTMSIHIFTEDGFRVQWHAQVLSLTPQRMLLFLAEEGEVVELLKTAFSMP